MTDLETILSWFQTGDMPTQEEFQETFSSFRHNNTKIPIAEVEGLQSSLNNKVNVGEVIGGGGDFIPLTGTESNKPLSGEFIMDDNSMFRTDDYQFRVGKDNGRPLITFLHSNTKNSGSLQAYTEGFEVQFQRQRDTETPVYQVFQMIEHENRLAYNNNCIIINNSDINISNEINNQGVITTKGININSDGITLEGLNNINGDSAFTRELVQKEDGTIGYIELKEGGVWTFPVSD